jgi:8-oxo-dGTP diphosphatase
MRPSRDRSSPNSNGSRSMRFLRRVDGVKAASGVGQFNVVVSAVVFHQESVLLLQRSSEETFLPSAWGLPCGKIHYGEDLREAALRELKEEASIGGIIERLAGASWFTSKNDGRRVENLQVNFVVRADSTEVSLDKSSQAFKWLPLKELDRAPINLDEFTRLAIAQALDARSTSGTTN